MSSLPNRQQIDKLNQRCYDHCYSYWDRFPFPDTLPNWVAKYQDPSLGRKALDIGSGTGQVAAWLQSEGFDVLCLDPSPTMINLCRAKGLHCLQTTFQDFNSSTNFSLVLAILSFIHIPRQEWQQQLDKVAQILPSKGLFILALIEGQDEGVHETSSGYPRFFSYFTQEEILKMAGKQFELLESRTYPAPKNSYLLFAFRKR